MKRYARFILILTLAFGSAAALPGPLKANGSAGVSVTLEPDAASASGVRWTVRMVVPYCGGYRVGRYVALRVPPPFILPRTVPSATVSFAGGPAAVVLKDITLEIAPAPGRIWSMLCGTDLALEIVLDKRAGLGNPGRAGRYVVQVSTETNPTPIRVPVTVRSARP